MNRIKFHYDDEIANCEHFILPCEAIAQKMLAQGTNLPACLDRLSLQRFRELLKQAGIQKWTLDQSPTGEIEFSWESPGAAILDEIPG